MSGGKEAGNAIIGALPAIVSPVIEAAIQAFTDGRVHALKAELSMALESSRLFELQAKINSEKAKEYYQKSLIQDALIQKQDDVIKSLQAEINEIKEVQ